MIKFSEYDSFYWIVFRVGRCLSERDSDSVQTGIEMGVAIFHSLTSLAHYDITHL